MLPKLRASPSWSREIEIFSSSRVSLNGTLESSSSAGRATPLRISCRSFRPR